jgi:hypothetical protein
MKIIPNMATVIFGQQMCVILASSIAHLNLNLKNKDNIQEVMMHQKMSDLRLISPKLK